MAARAAAATTTRRRTAKSRRLAVVEPDPATPTRVDFADPGEVREWADTLPERFLHCRELNHNWRPYNVGRHRDGGFERVLRCSRCKARKYQHLSTDGMLVGSPRLEYPDGYLHTGNGRITGTSRGVLRLASLSRMAVDLDALDPLDD